MEYQRKKCEIVLILHAVYDIITKCIIKSGPGGVSAGQKAIGVIMEQKRSSFTGKIGFVLAAAGSAVGLGNIWRFPYLAAKYGGGIFLLVYIILALTFGFALMAAEISLGRKTGLSAIGAFGKLNKKFTFLGWMEACVPAIILPYYSVIGGWVTKYLVTFVSGGASDAAGDAYLASSSPHPASPCFGSWFSSASRQSSFCSAWKRALKK